MYFQVINGQLTYFSRGVNVGSILEVTPEVAEHIEAIHAYCLTQRTPEQVVIDQLDIEKTIVETQREDAYRQINEYQNTLALIMAAFPEWKVNTTYQAGDILRYNEQLYKVLVAHTSANNTHPDQTPSVYVNITHKADPDNNPQPWVQPLGAADAYDIGDKVTHNGKLWISIAAANVWEPGVYGWEEIEE